MKIDVIRRIDIPNFNPNPSICVIRELDTNNIQDLYELISEVQAHAGDGYMIKESNNDRKTETID